MYHLLVVTKTCPFHLRAQICSKEEGSIKWTAAIATKNNITKFSMKKIALIGGTPFMTIIGKAIVSVSFDTIHWAHTHEAWSMTSVWCHCRYTRYRRTQVVRYSWTGFSSACSTSRSYSTLAPLNYVALHCIAWCTGSHGLDASDASRYGAHLHGAKVHHEGMVKFSSW